ncbi:hypothetical protein M2266_001801 [Streptomyces sp. SPB162]|nr:hypothetical protein [Streptomyces sp. SPB162]
MVGSTQNFRTVVYQRSTEPPSESSVTPPGIFFGSGTFTQGTVCSK